MAYERLSIIGNIGRIEKRGEANPYIKMSVAVDKKLPSGDKETIWYQVIINSPAAVKNSDSILSLYTPGKRVLVEGEMKLRPYLNNQGEPAIERTLFPIARPQLL